MTAGRPGYATAALLLLGHTALAIALFATNGGESLLGVLFVLGALAAWAKAFQGVLHGAPANVDGAVKLAWIVALGSTVVSTVLVFIRPPGIYLETSAIPFVLLDGCVAAVLATYYADVVHLRVLPPRAVFARRAALFFLALLIGAWMLHASPDPEDRSLPGPPASRPSDARREIDLRAGGDPDDLDDAVREERSPRRVHVPSFRRVPHHDRVRAHARHSLGRPRLAAGRGLLLWIAARRTAAASTPSKAPSPRREAWADLIAAIFLFHPRGPFVLEQGWTEPLAIPFLGGFVLFVLARRPLLASVCLGLFCAMKQHLVFYVPFLALAPGVGIVGVAVAGLVALATIAPFAIRSPYGFYRGAFSMLVHNPFRTDALNIPAELARVGVVMPTWVGFVAGLVPMAWLGRIPRKLAPLLLASSVAFTLFYVLGRQAFCNYYYLLDATVLFAAATLSDGAPPSEADPEPT